MGTHNVVYLPERADLAVPSYRRARRGASGAAACGPAAAQGEGPWHLLARQRAAHARALAPVALPRPAQVPTGTPPADTALQHALGDPARCARVAGADGPLHRGADRHLPAALVGGPAAGAGAWPQARAGVRVAQPVDATPCTGLADGRLRISGRLIDVCAELERLAAAETEAARARRA